MSRESCFMEEKRIEMMKEFRQLSPLERIRKMSAMFNDIIAYKAKSEGVSEHEIYRRYIEASR